MGVGLTIDKDMNHTSYVHIKELGALIRSQEVTADWRLPDSADAIKAIGGRERVIHDEVGHPVAKQERAGAACSWSPARPCCHSGRWQRYWCR